MHVLALGNPTIASGPFYDAFTANREGWQTFTISAFDTPNLGGLSVETLLSLPDGDLDVSRRPYLVTRRWVREKWSEWGPGHPLWEARVLGQFPMQSDSALISLTWLEEAASRPLMITGGKLSAGIDVAGPGEDETVVVITSGPSVVTLRAWTKADPRGEVVAALAPFRDRLETVKVDSAGIGYYLGKHLEDLGFPVRLPNVGQSPADPEKYANLKAEFYWGLRMRFQAGDVAGLADERAIGQLAGILYKHDARGRVVIESKEDARKRGVKSPDRAEAVMLAFARPQLGWYMVSEALDEGTKPRGAITEQVRDAFSECFVEAPGTCGDCASLVDRDGKPWCGLRLFRVQSSDPACEFYSARSD